MKEELTRFLYDLLRQQDYVEDVDEKPNSNNYYIWIDGNFNLWQIIEELLKKYNITRK